MLGERLLLYLLSLLLVFIVSSWHCVFFLFFRNQRFVPDLDVVIIIIVAVFLLQLSGGRYRTIVLQESEPRCLTWDTFNLLATPTRRDIKEGQRLKFCWPSPSLIVTEEPHDITSNIQSHYYIWRKFLFTFIQIDQFLVPEFIFWAKFTGILNSRHGLENRHCEKINCSARGD